MKVKHLIKKLSEMDPEANVYYGSMFETSSVSYVHRGTRLKKEKSFIIKAEADSTDPFIVERVQISLVRSNVDQTALTNKDVLITYWNGEWE